MWKSVNDLRPYENNPRNNEDAVPYVENSIRRFGFRVPIVIDADNVIVCGHTRFLAAKNLKIDKVPCICADDLSPSQIKAYRIADNKTQELSRWDYDLLADELQKIMDIDMSEFGFVGDIETGVAEKSEYAFEKKSGEIDISTFADDKFTTVCPCCGFRFNE
jgi:ParB-like chromosome segregation protein Spo0J